MIKTLVFLAVAYGLRALVQPHRSMTFHGKARPVGQKMLYALAGLGVVALGGLLFLVIQSLQVNPQLYHAVQPGNFPTSTTPLPKPPLEAVKSQEVPPTPAVEPGIRPPYVLLYTNEGDKSSSADKDKTRNRVRPRHEKKVNARSKPVKKP